MVLIEKHIQDVTPHWKLISLHTTAGTSVIPTATVCIRRPDGQLVQDAAIGDGPVDAIFKAVERVTGIAANLREFGVRGVTAGKDAQGEVSLELEVESDDRTFRGRAASTDIIEAVGRGIYQRRQRDPHPPRARPAARGHRAARRGGLIFSASGALVAPPLAGTSISSAAKGPPRSPPEPGYSSARPQAPHASRAPAARPARTASSSP